MKKCPYCAEEIQEEAIKCKHCFEFLDESQRPAVPGPPALPEKVKNALPWYFRTPFLVIMVLSIGPLALPLVWWRPKLTILCKIVITVAVLILTWGLWALTEYALKSVNESLEMYKNMTL